MKKRLPIGISEFKKVVEGNYLYVDKTKILYELMQGEQYFLSRPRRFGKSLLISTFEQLFLGNKELFKDTWIGSDASHYDWQKYPVIRLNFSGMSFGSGKQLEVSFNASLDAIAQAYEILLPASYNFVDKFIALMKELSEKNNIVVLIDEYDYPLIANVSCLDIAKEVQRVMQNFFAALKSTEQYMRFCFITGVSRFAKTSLFSGLNNVKDLTLNPKAAELLGYTQQELEFYFPDYLEALSQKTKLSLIDTKTKIKKFYNGYRFSELETRVYNPFSVINCFDDGAFNSYWFESGSPRFLIELLPAHYHEIEELPSAFFDYTTLNSSFETQNIKLDLLLYQTGYLTISSFQDGIYTLDFPNQEVSVAFNTHMLAFLAHIHVVTANQIGYRCKQALEINNLDSFVDQLRILLAGIPHNLHQEKEAYYHSILHTLVYVLGCSPISERSVSTGRLDTVIETSKHVYIFEYKLNKSAQEALDQIEDKKYYQAYFGLNKQIVLVGLNFAYQEKQLEITSVHKILP